MHLPKDTCATDMGQPSRLRVLFFPPAGYENRHMDPDPGADSLRSHSAADSSKQASILQANLIMIISVRST